LIEWPRDVWFGRYAASGVLDQRSSKSLSLVSRGNQNLPRLGVAPGCGPLRCGNNCLDLLAGDRIGVKCAAARALINKMLENFRDFGVLGAINFSHHPISEHFSVFFGILS
jgi:hypothetical protein